MTNNTPCGYIDDGMEADGYIEEVPGLHPALKFKYRPTLSRTRARVLKTIKDTEDDKPEQAEALAAAHVGRQVASWDLESANGLAPVPSTESVLKVQPTLSIKLFRVVMGLRPNDSPPNDSDADTPDASGLLAEVDGIPDDHVHPEAHLKNSAAVAS